MTEPSSIDLSAGESSEESSERFRAILEQVIEPVYCDPSEAELLKGFRQAGGVYADFAELIEAHPQARGNLVRIARELNPSIALPGSESVLISTPTALSFLGFESARNFLAASIIRGHPETLLPGSTEVDRALHFALRGEAMVPEKSPLRLDYFMAGLVFDFLREAFPGERAMERLEEAWETGKRDTQVALRLALNLGLPESFQRDLCLDGMLHDVGRFLLDLVILNSPPKKRAPLISEAAPLGEKAKYRFAHSVYGYLALDRLGFVKETTGVVLYHHQPFLAKRLGELGWMRATLIWLADTVSRFQQKTSTAGKAKSLGVPPKNLMMRWYQCCKPALNITPEPFIRAIERI